MKIINKYKNSKLLKTGARYSITSTLSSVLMMIVGFLNMRWLGPELLGIWQSLNIIVSYMPIVQLGIQSGLNLELPIALGKRDEKKAMKLVSVGLKYARVLSLFLTVVAIVVITILYIRGTEIKTLTGAIVVAIIIITSCFKLHYIATYRSANAFDRLTNIYWVDIFVTAGLVYFIYKYHYFGLLIFQVVKDLVHTFLLWYFAPYRHLKAVYEKKSFIILLKRGIFMTVFNEVKGIVESMPRVILLWLGGVVQVGLFNPALTIGIAMNLIPNQISQFLHPQLGYKYGETKCAKDNWPYLRSLYIYAPLCILPFAAIGWLIMPPLLEYVFPKYVESLWPIRIMMVGFLFSTTYFGRGFLITIKAYKETLLLLGLDLAMFVILPLILYSIYPGYLLIDLSIGISLSYIVTYFVNIFVVKRTLFLPKYNMPSK